MDLVGGIHLVPGYVHEFAEFERYEWADRAQVVARGDAFAFVSFYFSQLWYLGLRHSFDE